MPGIRKTLALTNSKLVKIVNKLVALSVKTGKSPRYRHPLKFNPLIEHLDTFLENVDLQVDRIANVN